MSSPDAAPAELVNVSRTVLEDVLAAADTLSDLLEATAAGTSWAETVRTHIAGPLRAELTMG